MEAVTQKTHYPQKRNGPGVEAGALNKKAAPAEAHAPAFGLSVSENWFLLHFGELVAQYLDRGGG